MDKVSVVVPVYNKEKLLIRCIRSIEHQDYKNIELIVINDGSTDDSLNIIKEISKEYNNIKLINQKNKGVAVARNRGIEASSGKWITFVDADDYVEEDYISNLVMGTKYGFNDLVICGYKNIEGEKSVTNIPDAGELSKARVNELFSKRIFSFICTVWAKLFNLELIKKNNIHFHNLNLGEDTCFVFDFLRYVDHGCFANNTGYINCINEGSLSHGDKDHLKDLLSMTDYITKCWNIPTGSKESQFLLLRDIKIELSNKINNKSRFYADLDEIRSLIDISSLKYKLCEDYTDKILLFLLKHNANSFLFYSFKI